MAGTNTTGASSQPSWGATGLLGNSVGDTTTVSCHNYSWGVSGSLALRRRDSTYVVPRRISAGAWTISSASPASGSGHLKYRNRLGALDSSANRAARQRATAPRHIKTPRPLEMGVRPRRDVFQEVSVTGFPNFFPGPGTAIAPSRLTTAQRTVYDQGLQQAKPSHPGRHKHGTTSTPSDGSSSWGVVPQAHKLPDAARANCASTDRRIDDRPKHRQPTQAHPKGSNTTSLTQRS